ncbi:CTP synthetase [uncultured Tateyamaria sp.]|uniref:CTP synthetase n=1 Tax=uncultured Tateyamaria sp. TaxID=455651 RepID=UPI00262CF646|nr:CTP synthetase [uncultured Tateyamaria sp.]
MQHFMLFFALHIFIGSTMAGAGVIAALSMGYGGASPILIAAAIGFAAAFPVTWLVQRRIVGTG